MANFAKNVVKTIFILIISIIIGYGSAFIVAGSSSDIGNTFIPFAIWGLVSVVSIIMLRRQFGGGMKKSKGGSWGPPEQSRDRVINSPQFVGRFDRSRGLLDSTARMVELDSSEFQTTWMYQPKNLNIIRFRGEILDQNGSPLDYIPVEIKGENRKWVGNIVDGDRVRVEGKIEEDGILHAKIAFNYSTNSWVGERS